MWRLACLALPLLVGCSEKQRYYVVQQLHGSQCSQLVDRQDYDRCMSRNRTDYETYRKERELIQAP